MSSWAAILNDPVEKEAFFSLLDQYFSHAPRPVVEAAPARPTPAARAPRIAPAGLSSSSAAPTPPPAAPAPAKGPKIAPAGLTSSKTMAGSIPTSSGKAFAKGVFTSKGPMSQAEQDKNVHKGSLVTRPLASISGLGPPPVPASRTRGKKVLYDYPGTEPDDLPATEGEMVEIVQRIDADWLKCRNQQGQEGLIPTAYVEA